MSNINYFVLQEVAAELNIDYNRMCRVFRAAEENQAKIAEETKREHDWRTDGTLAYWLAVAESDTKHDWRSTGVDTHRGEYWYKCNKCGESDWIASYGTMDQLMPRECKPRKQT